MKKIRVYSVTTHVPRVIPNNNIGFIFSTKSNARVISETTLGYFNIQTT